MTRRLGGTLREDFARCERFLNTGIYEPPAVVERDITHKLRAVHAASIARAEELLARPDASEIPAEVRKAVERHLAEDREKIALIDAGIAKWTEPSDGQS